MAADNLDGVTAGVDPGRKGDAVMALTSRLVKSLQPATSKPGRRAGGDGPRPRPTPSGSIAGSIAGSKLGDAPWRS
jgi:hypothetical protein